MPPKRKGTDHPDQPPPRRGRPRKTTTLQDAEPELPNKKITLKIPRLSGDTPATSTTTPMSTSASSDSEVLPDTTLESSVQDLSEPDNDVSDEDVEAATQALLGLANSRCSGEADFEYDDDDGEEEEEEDLEEEEEEEEEVLEITLEFLAPLGGASDSLSLSSTISERKFFKKIAEKMDVPVKHLDIAYKLSSWPQRERPRKLETDAHILQLFNQAREELTDKKKSKTKKKLHVIIVDLSEAKEKADKKGKKGPAKKGRSKKADDSGSDSDNINAGVKKRTGTDYMRELEAKHKCDKHGSFCIVAANGEHITLSNANLSLWSMLLAQDVHKSISDPPPVLNLPMETGTKAPPPARRIQQQPPPGPGPYPYSYPYTYYPPQPGPYGQPPGPYGELHYPPPPTPAPVPDPAVPRPQQSPPPASTRLRKGESLDSQDDDLPTMYTPIGDWLLDLDTSERGADGHQFHRFTDAFRANGFMRGNQIADAGKDGDFMLREMVGEGLSVGASRLLIKYAIADCKKNRKAAREWAAK